MTAEPQAPTNTGPPTIAGTAQQGQTLTASPGSWTGSPTVYSYEWKRCGAAGGSCVPIPLATGPTYLLTEADVGRTLRVAVVASNAAGSSAPASSAHTEVVTAEPQAPTNTGPPTIAGTAQQGQTLTASPGSWTGSPTEYSYEWKRCGAAGGSCKTIEGALAPTYLLTEADVGRTLRVAVVASNSAGSSEPATSTPTPVVTGNGAVQHLEYVVQDGTTSVYDIDHEFTLVKTISLPLTSDEVRGVSVAPSTHTMYIMHGGDGPMNGSGNGSVLAYDLVSEKVIWNVELSTGIDSGQVSSDGEKLYIPTGENTSSGIWNVLSTANGEVIGTIQGPSGAHNTVASNDGRYVYLGGRASNVLDAYETATAEVRSIGPLIGTERPFTVNGSNTLAFTTATNFDGFQISSVTTGNVLFTVSLGEIPIGFPFTTASHGIALSPDERQVYVIDAVNKVVQFWDVSRVKEGVAPTQIGVVPVAGLSGNENACVYDCGRGGWLQLSLDGRYLFVGDSGEVIDTATREVITTLATLAQTKKSIEVDWQNGVPIATSGRTGVGYVP
ncbi:MAG: WD40 repeat domain-containing protein [Actinobacteria bacterium]|nr:MAG: WD40 repeat domain-containing protein [Actinomycetota bacterium]